MAAQTQGTLHFESFPDFVGQMLFTLMQAQNTSEGQEMPTFLVNIWIAASSLLGLTAMTQMVQKSPQLQSLLEQYTHHPLQQHARPLTPASPFQLESTLHQIAGFTISSEDYTQQRQYTALWERLESEFHTLRDEYAQQMIPAQEYQIEMQGLFAKALYSLTRLQRS
ncbi:MAG: hypothetical protein AAGJ35_06735 [Myxococcota bacterium]